VIRHVAWLRWFVDRAAELRPRPWDTVGTSYQLAFRTPWRLSLTERPLGTNSTVCHTRGCAGPPPSA
jgi:hypothetical protein